MAFQPLTFTKSWEDPTDFPTYEPDEAQVRADLQYLHNEMRDAFNGLVASLNATSAAANLPISVPGLSAGTIQAAIEETLAEVQKAAAGQIVDGSITREKLAASLLARIYGGRLIVSWNTPGAAQTPDSDYPVGQLWLRPALDVANEAQPSWSLSGCTAQEAEGGWRFSADRTMSAAGVSQRLEGLGPGGSAVLLHLALTGQDSALTSLTLYCNSAPVQLPESGWLETTLDSSGSLELQLQAQWPSAEAAGYFQVGDLTIVPVGALEASLPDCAPPEDWEALLQSHVPFTAFRLPRAVFLQVAPGQWETVDEEVLPVSRGGTGRKTVAAGQLLYGAEDGMAALDPPEASGAVLGFSEGRPVWQSLPQLGALQAVQGSYTGNQAERTIDLGATPRLLVVQGAFEQPALLLQGQRITQTLRCTQAGDGGAYPTYGAGLSLQGGRLTIWLSASQEAVACGAAAKAWNLPDVPYAWLALC